MFPPHLPPPDTHPLPLRDRLVLLVIIGFGGWGFVLMLAALIAHCL